MRLLGKANIFHFPFQILESHEHLIVLLHITPPVVLAVNDEKRRLTPFDVCNG